MLLRSRIFLTIWPIIIIVAVSLPAYFNLLQAGYFGTHDDVQIMRLFEMKKCFQDLQLPCRFVPDMGAGYGHPLFNYHPVLPYYLGMVFRFAGLSLINTSKILFILSLILSGGAMYLLSKEFFGKVAGVVAATAYIYAPYHAVDIFVRGALTESWGMVFFPVIFWGLYKLITDGRWGYLVVSSLAIAGLNLSHNVTALLFLPIALIWSVFWMSVLRRWRWSVLGAMILGLGLSSFFVLPSLLEQNLLNIRQAVGYYSFSDHFVDFNQLFLKRNWGYGPSIAGANDDLSYQIGWPHWWLALGSCGMVGFLFWKKIKSKQTLMRVGAFVLLMMVSAIWMSTNYSEWVWKYLPLLYLVQFPWRYLAVVIFANGLLVGFFVECFKGKLGWLVSVLVITLAIGLNFNYFQFNRYYPGYSDLDMLSGWQWDRQSMTTLEDYVPKSVKLLPTHLAPNSPAIIDGVGKISDFRLRSNRWSFQASISSPKARIEVPVFDFPIWRFWLDSQSIKSDPVGDSGLIELTLPRGNHLVEAKFVNTLLREVSNIISLISLAGFSIMVIWQSKVLVRFKKSNKKGRMNGAIL